MKRKLLTFILTFFVAFGVNAQKTELSEKTGKVDLNTKTVTSTLKTGLKTGKLVFLSETFDTEIPGTWTVNNTGTGTLPGWFWADIYTANAIPLTGFACIDSDENGSGETTAGELISPSFDCSSATLVNLEFDARYDDLNSGNNELFTVDVWDGATWQNVITWDEDHGDDTTPEHVSIDITAYANVNCQVRFVYQDDGWDWFAGVDNISVIEPEAHDLGVTSVAPAPYAVPGNTYTPTATIHNFGANNEDVYNVEIEITDASNGSQVYIDDVDFTYTIITGTDFDAEMSSIWIPASVGTYTITATVTVAGDTYAGNDVFSDECTVAYMYFMGNEDVTTCQGSFYDSGGPDEYFQNDEDYTMTIYPATADNMIQVDFSFFNCDGSTYDYLEIYNGTDVSAPLIVSSQTVGDAAMLVAPYSASNVDGALTFHFFSSTVVPNPGWEATLSCVSAVTFHVTDAGITDIENALVEVGGQSGTTDADGNAMFALPEGATTYTVTANFCDPYTDSYTVTSDPGQVVEVNLTCLNTYSVTFNAYENFGTNEPVAGADITVTYTPTSTVWNETTNASGNAVFTLPATDFEFSVYAESYTYSGTTFFSVSGDMSVDLPLDEDIIVPTGLIVENIDEHQGTADFSWFEGFSGSILAVDHDASNAVEFTDDWPYIQSALDANELDYTYYEADATTFEGPDLTTMQQYDAIIWFTGEGWQNNQTMTSSDETNLAAYLAGGGKLFISSQDYIWDVYSQDDDYTFTSGQFPYDYLGLVSVHQDAWWTSGEEHIAHEGAVGSLAEGYSFYCDDIYTTTKEGLSADQITGHNATEMLNVTDAPAGVTAIQNGNVVCWTGSIASVTDAQIRADLLMDILDYLAVGKSKETKKSFENYNVYLDDMDTPVATGIEDSTYQFTGLTPGDYIAGVSAVYTTGESDIATIDFTVPELTYSVTFYVHDQGDNALEGATVEVAGQSGDTDASGEVAFMLEEGSVTYTVTYDTYDPVSDTYNVTTATGQIVDVEIVTVNINEINSNISVYPNPSNGVFIITVNEKYILEVIDITGKVINTQIIRGNNIVKITDSGVYFFRFSNNKTSLVQRVILR